MKRGFAKIHRTNDEMPLADLGFEDETEFLVTGKRIDDLDDRFGFECNLIEHYGSRRGREDAPPLPVGVVGCGKARKGRVFIVDKEPHGSCLIGEIHRTPEAGEKGCILTLADGRFGRRVENAAPLCQFVLGFAE